MSAIADALSGGGMYLKWENPGTAYTGIITDVTMRQSRKYESTELDTWDDGTPKMQIVLTLATDYRDQSQPDDDGTRQISINLWSGQKKALVAACKNAGVPEPVKGMGFSATHVSGVGNAKAPRVFEYVLKAGPTGLAEQLGTVEPAPVDTATPVEQARSLLLLGVSPADVAKATGLPDAVVAALGNVTPPF
jgi:hypothetical protein